MNTISNERLETIAKNALSEERRMMAAELLALRKEREKAEPVVKAAEKLVRCKGRYHSEQNYRALAALFGVTTPDLPPLETDTTSQQFESLADKAVSGWIPCSERMPVEKDIVLVVDDGYFVCEAQYREGDFFSAVRGNNEFFETTCRDVEFWQPLPEPPCK